jgi:hypothetical protein
VITLFHKPNHAPSIRVLTLLKQANANASAVATEDQASTHHPDPGTAPQTPSPSDVNVKENLKDVAQFDLDVTEALPTEDQLKSILEYVGPNKAGELVSGAKGEAEALRLIREGKEAFVRPVTVDWHLGKAGM